MADYPFTGFNFRVEWGGVRFGFTEVTGLEIEVQPIDYREGDELETGPRKIPGIPKYSNLTLKRGIVANDNQFFEWLKTFQQQQVERRDIVVSLLNSEHQPAMVWKLHNAFVVRLEGPSLKATGNEIAIESIEVAHEKLTVESAGG